MSRAFDTVNRLKLVKVMDTIVDADERRMIHLLLVNTNLSIQIKDITGTPFTTTTGTPQSDSLSPVMMSPLSALALITSNSHYHRSKVSLKPGTCTSMKPKQSGWN